MNFLTRPWFWILIIVIILFIAVEVIINQKEEEVLNINNLNNHPWVWFVFLTAIFLLIIAFFLYLVDLNREYRQCMKEQEESCQDECYQQVQSYSGCPMKQEYATKPGCPMKQGFVPDNNMETPSIPSGIRVLNV